MLLRYYFFSWSIQCLSLVCESFHYLTWFHLTDVCLSNVSVFRWVWVGRTSVCLWCLLYFRRSSLLICSQQVNTQPQFPLNTERISLVAIKRPHLNLSNSQATTPGQPRPLPLSLSFYCSRYHCILKKLHTSPPWFSLKLVHFTTLNHHISWKEQDQKVLTPMDAEHLAPTKLSPKHFIHMSNSIKGNSYN